MSLPFPDQIEVLQLEEKHLAVLASAPCAEVYQEIPFSEGISIREIAEEVNRSTASVGEHIAKLLDVGLITVVGTRKRHAREEILYALKASHFLFDPVGQSEGATEECIRKFRCDLRQTDRMSAAAFRAIRDVPELYDAVLIRSYVGYFDKESALKVKKALADLAVLFSELHEEDREVREKGDYTRIKLSMVMLPTVRESESRVKKAKGTK